MKTIRTIAAAMASILAVSAFSAMAGATTYIDEFGNVWDDDDDDGYILYDNGYSIESYNVYTDSYDVYDYTTNYNYSYNYNDYNDYVYTNTNTNIYSKDVYVGQDYYYGAVYYNSSIGYFAYTGGGYINLGWNYTLQKKPTVNYTTTTYRPATVKNNDPAYSAGLGFSTPSYVIGGYSYDGCQIIGNICELRYSNKKGNQIAVRKAKGSADITTKSWKINGTKVTLKGIQGFNSNDYYIATWTKGGYSYSVLSTGSLTLEGIKSIVRAVI